MKRFFSSIFMLMMLLLTGATFVSCSDDDNSTGSGMIIINDDQLTWNVDAESTEFKLDFIARTNWTLAADENSQDWLKVFTASGIGGTYDLTIGVGANVQDDQRTGTLLLKSGNDVKEIKVVQAGSTLKIIDPSQIANYAKYLTPGTWNEGFEKGPEYMLRSDAKWSWWRMKQSEHFFVFWEPGFGDDPNAESVPEELRVDVDDLLQKAEQFYKTNVEKLGMATIGEGKSVLDNYKMQIYLLYQTEWLATGSGYDNKIGALWVNPSTCKPVGSTIGHEIGHSFQYQVSADKLFTGEVTEDANGLVPVGFRYGFGANGAGGCAYWEQCAQWQSFQDYPVEAFTQDANVQVWLKSHHRHFNHEFMRYASYWFQYWFTQKHGIEAYARIWKESKYPEDPVQTYMRLYCNNDLNTLYKDMYEYSAHCADYDFDAVHQYKTDAAINYSTKFYKSNGYYQVAYSNCPGTTGFNLIPLNVPSSGKVSATLEGLAPGSALAAGDPGTVVDGDGNAKSTVTSYNKQSNQQSDYRYGFVAITKDGKSHYGEMQKGKSGSVSYDVPANTERLYLCVLAAPDKYNRNAWDDDETNDEQWPYRVKFSGTDLLGNVDIPAGNPTDASASLEINLDASSTDYPLHTFNLLNEGVMQKIAVAFKMQPSEIAAATLDDATVKADGFNGPAEGKIAVGLTNPNGSISYAYSANGIGFWIAEDGSAGTWGDGTKIYFEYNSGAYGLTVGHKPGATEKGKTYTIKPTMVYNKGGKLHKAVITIKMKY